MTEAGTRHASGYAELHTHSCFSFLDGVSTPSDLVAEAVRLELDAIAVLDHDGFYGIVQTATAAREAGLPTVIGAELSIGLTERHNGVPDPDGHHLLVLARDPEGYRRLSRVIARANLAGSKGLPAYNRAALADEHDEHWAILTGCRKGAVPAALARGGPGAAEEALGELIDLFGRRNVYVELWHHHEPGDDERNDALARLAAGFDLPTVATTNAHYATPAEHRLARVVAAIRARSTLADLNGWLPTAPTAHLRSAAEQRRRFAAWPGAVERAGLLGRELAFDLSLIAPRLPDFPTPPGRTEDDHLRELAAIGASRLYGPRESERIPGAWKQIDYELGIIAELGFAGYFLVVWDIVEFCRRNNIYCQGRGSAANSAVCYSLGITNADPVSLGLLFERFLSPARDGPPDIDVDIESGRREEVIQYVYAKHGREHAAQVANVITYRRRSARRDAARVFAHSSPDSELPDQVQRTADDLLDLPRHLGVHSGGMVICDRPIIEVCPVEWATTPNRSVLQWDKDDCAAAGLVKFDLLGLGMLEAIHRTIDLVAEHEGEHIDLALLPQEPEVYERLCAADTVGVFQVESRAQMATLPRLKPRNFHDLVVEVALIRPGPIQGGSVHPYLRRRNGREPVTYLHPLLERSLAKTLGVPIFQEQLMQMAIDVAGFSPADADRLRQAMGSKRSDARMQALRELLYRGMAGNGITGETAEAVFESMRAFANFGFPESHAASFAYLVYASAWLKLRHPEAFLAGLLNSQPMGFWSPTTLVADARRHGVTVRRPDVNHSAEPATLEPLGDSGNGNRNGHGSGNGFAVRLGLRSVKSIDRVLARRIAAAAPYRSLGELVRRTGLNRSQLESLATAGATRDIGHGNRRADLWAAGIAAANRPGQLPDLTDSTSAPLLPSMTHTELLAADLSTTGITVDSSAFELLEQALVERNGHRDRIPANRLRQCHPGQRIRVAGIITHRQRPRSAGGVTFLNLEDDTGLINVICSRGLWERHRDFVDTARALLVTGRVESSEDVINIMAERLEDLPLSVAVPARNYC